MFSRRDDYHDSRAYQARGTGHGGYVLPHLRAQFPNGVLVLAIAMPGAARVADMQYVAKLIRKLTTQSVPSRLFSFQDRKLVCVYITLRLPRSPMLNYKERRERRGADQSWLSFCSTAFLEQHGEFQEISSWNR
jgi:hypothetical protein